METKTKILIGIGIVFISGWFIVLDDCQRCSIQQIGSFGGCDRVCYPDYPWNLTDHITESQAIAIANATEEVQEFLKLYPDTEIKILNFYWETFGVRNDTSEVFYVGVLWNGSTPLEIAIDHKTGKILAKYPKLEYIKKWNYCENDDDCNLIEPICGNLECTLDNSTCEQMCKCITSINFIHRIHWNENRDEVSCNDMKHCKMCAPISSFEAKCINHTCTAINK
ncbi:MAG: hypothetical protein CVT88_03640 [Candidatus Altiarchaeales archaeon HGW-Altiarchaeales-1]|nr:MAG: hypothetical protein CVT88_03640 [Candidatus Altiarchaeales archaeon HGW-Altiarchaeales-1]